VQLPLDTCGIWHTSPRPDDTHLADLLHPAERERAARFRLAADRAAYTAAHALARLVAGDLTGEVPHDLRFSAVCASCGGPHGKPRLRGTSLEMSISHSHGCAAVAFAWDVQVGIDVEDLVPPRIDGALVAAALSAGEQAKLALVPAQERNAAFLRYWTRKEAVLKATGYGLAVAPPMVAVSSPGEPPRLLAWTSDRRLDPPVCISDVDLGHGHVAAVAVLGRPLSIAVHDAMASARVIRNRGGAAR
jgi:4'-phosphopantetheinyl transferase